MRCANDGEHNEHTKPYHEFKLHFKKFLSSMSLVFPLYIVLRKFLQKPLPDDITHRVEWGSYFKVLITAIYQHAHFPFKSHYVIEHPVVQHPSIRPDKICFFSFLFCFSFMLDKSTYFAFPIHPFCSLFHPF